MTTIGIPREIKDHEFRVALTPAGADLLTSAGHKVLVEESAGVGSGITDKAYAAAGARMVPRDEVFAQAELIVKVKEPQPVEYDLIRAGQTVFTYFHFAADRALTDAMLQRGAACIAYETVQTADGYLPLLAPMSDVAGRVAVTAALRFLERPAGGKGKLISGIPGVQPGVVLVLGGGIAGTSAARISADLGAETYVLDIDQKRLRFLFDTCPANLHPLASNAYTIRDLLPRADVVIGTVLIPGGRTPTLVTDGMLDLMEPGSVLIDISIDQGGCIETVRPTTHTNPVFTHKGIIHYGVTNMPGAVAHTSTRGLTNATLPYLAELAAKGTDRALAENPSLRKGLNIRAGRIRHPELARSFGMDCADD